MNAVLNYSIVIVLALIIGSFLNVVIYRLPIILHQTWHIHCCEFLSLPVDRKLTFTLAYPSSHCPHCKKPLRFWENIPVFSFMRQCGKCTFCHQRIPLQYPLVETGAALFAILCFHRWGWEMRTVVACIFCWSLLTLFFIDLHHLILPDEITIPLLWIGLLSNTSSFFTDINSAIFGAVFGYLFLYVVGELFKRVAKKEGIGHGDYKLLAALGAWMGWKVIPFILLGSSLLGILIFIILLSIKKIELESRLAYGSCLIIISLILFFTNGFSSSSIPLNIF